MRCMLRLLPVLVAPFVVSCDRNPVEVSHPFYLTYPENPADMALFRCPEGPKNGCAQDGLPGPKVIAAGADRRFVTVAVERDGGTAYYYFARIPQETRGWGLNPEKIKGPLTEEEFKSAKSLLALPDLNIRP